MQRELPARRRAPAPHLVSDEAEQSGTTWSELVDQIAAKKGDPSLVRVSAIAGTAADAAAYFADSDACQALEGTGYAEAVAATGGTFLSICSDWAASMIALADEIVSQDVFELAQLDVVPDSVAVTIDGQPASGWAFDAGTNSASFDAGSAPTQGSTVVIDYATYGSASSPSLVDDEPRRHRDVAAAVIRRVSIVEPAVRDRRRTAGLYVLRHVDDERNDGLTWTPAAATEPPRAHWFGVICSGRRCRGSLRRWTRPDLPSGTRRRSR
jgi:hypothetical protein